MSYDEIISYLGEFGKYQFWIFVILCLNSMLTAMHAFSLVFIMARPNFRCALPWENVTDIDVNRFALPGESSETIEARPCDLFHNASNESIACSSYVYDQSVFLNSVVSEWNLVCDRSWLITLQQSLFMVGLLLGSIVFGQLADKFGRRPILLLSIAIQATSGVCAALSRDFIIFTIARMFVGATIPGTFIVAYVLAMEMLGQSQRLYGSVAIMTCYPLGALALSGYAYIIPDWRYLQLAVALTGFVLLPYLWLVPESTRWLLTTNRRASAMTNIKKIINFNKLNITIETIEALLMNLDKKNTAEKEEPLAPKATVLDLLKYPNMRRKSLLIFFDWFVITGTYYGLSWNTSQLGDDVRLNFIICAAVEVPAHCSMLFVLNRLGRRLVVCSSLLISGFGLLLTMAPPNEMNWLIVMFAMLGKFGITAAYGAIYMFSAEQFPTVVRNVGIGAASMMARVGGILAPFAFIGAQLWRPLPLVICGSLAFLGGTLTLLLPETFNKPTLETLADGENFTRKQKSPELEREIQNTKIN